MKVSSTSLQSFCDKPPASVRAVLVYGPNEGLVRERVQALIHAIIGQPMDPFRIRGFIAIFGARYESVSNILRRSLTGKRRVLVITEANDRLTKSCESLLRQKTNLSHFAYGTLDSGRPAQTYEQQAHYAAIACYADEGASLRTVVKNIYQLF